MGSYRKEQGSTSDHGSSDKKCCSDCKTTKTPLWRYGPSGPKTLCNACGIKHRKSNSMIELRKGKMGKNSDGLKYRKQLKMNLMTPLEESSSSSVVVLKKQRSPRQWSDVERAALLLMAFSCGAVFD